MEWNEMIQQAQPYAPHVLVGLVMLMFGFIVGSWRTGSVYKNFLLNGILFETDTFTVTNEQVGTLKDSNPALLGKLSVARNVDRNSFVVSINGLRYPNLKPNVTADGEVWWRPDWEYEIEAGDEVVIDYRHGHLVRICDLLSRQPLAQPDSEVPGMDRIAAALCGGSDDNVFYRGRAYFKLIPMTDLREGDKFVIIDENTGYLGEVLVARGDPHLGDNEHVTIEAESISSGTKHPCVFCGTLAFTRKGVDGMAIPACENCAIGAEVNGVKKLADVSPKYERRGDGGAFPVIPGVPVTFAGKRMTKRDRQREAVRSRPEIKHRFWGVTKNGQIVADATAEEDLKKWAKDRDVFVQLDLMGERPIPKDVLKRFKLAPGTPTDEELGGSTINKALDEAARKDAEDRGEVV